METKKITEKDLMIGDWVYSTFSDKPCKVQAIELSEHGYGSVRVTGVDGVKDIVSLSPIPLTAEVLGKNGYASYEEDKDSFHDKSCVFIKQKDGGYGVCIDNVRTISGLIHYVHELQHVIRDAKVNKEIVL